MYVEGMELPETGLLSNLGSYGYYVFTLVVVYLL